MDAPLASLAGLPDDVLAHIFERLDSTSLGALRAVSRLMERRVLALGIPLYLTHNAMPSLTLSRDADPKTQFYHTTRISRAIARHELYAVQVGRAWPRAMPALSLAADALLLGIGNSVRIHPLRPMPEYGHRAVCEPAEVDVLVGDSARRVEPNGHGQPRRTTDTDIVGLHALPTHPEGGDFVVAQFDGTVQRFVHGVSSAHYPHPRGIHALAGCGSLVLTANGTGGSAGIGARRGASAFSSAASTPDSGSSARLFNATSPWTPTSTIALPSRAWGAHLSPRGAFFGLRGGIHWHATRDGGLSPKATVLLPAGDSRSAAYGLVAFPTPAGSPLSATLLSAWHDGTARLHDLRTNRQVLALSDPWSDAALFSAAFVGAHGIVAGGAEHGIVNVWDVRFVAPRAWNNTADNESGWSVFSPHGRGSPVYALAGDGGRVWGVTERRAFVLAFDDRVVLQARREAGGETRGRRGSMAAKDVPAGWKPRGGKVGWTVHYGEYANKESVMGYRHGEGGMKLFESRVWG